jgi:uncharacterized protein YndB with AHSA1/START domain
MTTDLTTGTRISIDAPVSAVWTALTDPDLIERWFLGVRTETTWEEGSSIVHTGTWQGKSYRDKGEIVRFEPERVLAHTHWSDMSGLPDSAEHYQEVTWTLKTNDATTEVAIAETNLPSDEAKAMSEQTWPTVLSNLKRVVEESSRNPGARPDSAPSSPG